MRVEYEELMEQLGVGHILSAYETRPWFLHDADLGIMCSAEVRVGPGESDVEAEIQFLYDEDNKKPPIEIEEEKPEKKIDRFTKFYDDDDDEDEVEIEVKPKTGKTEQPDGPQQIMMMRFIPNKEGIWSGMLMFVRGEDYKNKVHSWDERGAAFFFAFIASIQMGEIPDVDELIEEHLVDKSRGRRGRRGKVGKKGFKVEQKGMSMGMK